MKVDEVADFLIKEGVRPRFFAINTVVADDAVVLYQEGPARWVVFYTERGVRSSERVYDSEDAACQEGSKHGEVDEGARVQTAQTASRDTEAGTGQEGPRLHCGLHRLDHASAVTGPKTLTTIASALVAHRFAWVIHCERFSQPHPLVDDGIWHGLDIPSR